MSKSLIKYSLFQRRRKFDPLTLFRQNKSITYEEFVKALALKGSDSPGIEYFQRVKLHFESLNKPSVIKSVEEVAVKSEEAAVQSTVQVEEPSKVKEVVVKTEDVSKPKRRRQRKKVEEKDHDKKDNDE